jgi:hypothetical protein
MPSSRVVLGTAALVTGHLKEPWIKVTPVK